jgi:hypothetical protein
MIRQSVLLIPFLSFIIVSFLLVTACHAHSRSESFSKWHLKTDPEKDFDTITVSVVMKLSTALKMNWKTLEDESFEQVFLKHSVDNIFLGDGKNPIKLQGEPKIFISKKTGYIKTEWILQSPRGKNLTMHNNAYYDMAPNHTHIARMTIGDHQTVEKIFNARDRKWDIRRSNEKLSGNTKKGPAGSSLYNYWIIGTEHIISGLDHLAFLLGLLLLCRRPRDAGLLVTGFTLGHSTTLGLGVLGIIKPDTVIVEALIGFSIALVAIENVMQRSGKTGNSGLYTGFGIIMAGILTVLLTGNPPLTTFLGLAIFSFCYLRIIGGLGDAGVKLRLIVTFLFGLVHGFGFAGGLKEIGLPTDRFLSALLGFNLGVETGQLVILLLIWWFTKLTIRLLPAIRQKARQLIVIDCVSAGLCGLGMFWFVSRASVY